MYSKRRVNGRYANREQWIHPRILTLSILAAFTITSLYFWNSNYETPELLKQPQFVHAQEPQATPVPESSSIKSLICEVFGNRCRVAVQISCAESGLREDAIGDHTLDYKVNGKVFGASYGLFQIRSLPGRPAVKDLLTARKNIEYAYKISKGGTDWTAWSVYNNGAYKNATYCEDKPL